MQVQNTAGLAIVFRNPEPQREAQHPEGWILMTSEHEFNVFIRRDHGKRPRVVRKEARNEAA